MVPLIPVDLLRLLEKGGIGRLAQSVTRQLNLCDECRHCFIFSTSIKS